jgi:hypothetical protein
MFEIVTAQVKNHSPVFVIQADAFAGSQADGFVPVPVLVYQFSQSNTGVLTGCFAILGIAGELSQGVVLCE